MCLNDKQIKNLKGSRDQRDILYSNKKYKETRNKILALVRAKDFGKR